MNLINAAVSIIWQFVAILFLLHFTTTVPAFFGGLLLVWIGNFFVIAGVHGLLAWSKKERRHAAF